MSAGGDPADLVVPSPLGWCVPHLQQDERVAAVALSLGTSVCEDCAVAAQEDLDGLPERLEEEVRVAADRLFGPVPAPTAGAGPADDETRPPEPPRRVVVPAARRHR